MQPQILHVTQFGHFLLLRYLSEGGKAKNWVFLLSFDDATTQQCIPEHKMFCFASKWNKRVEAGLEDGLLAFWVSNHLVR